MADQFITDLSKLDKATQDILAKNGQTSMSGQAMTAQEYLASRGGVNPVTHKYGDSYNPNIDLNDAEYTAAIAGKFGVDAGKALNSAREKKLQAYIAANPESPEALKYSMSSKLESSTNSGKTVSSVTKQTDGSSIVIYSDGSQTVIPAGSPVPTIGSTTTGLKTDAQIAAETKAAENQAARKSAYDTLYNEFNKYGLGSLVESIKGMITDAAVSPSELSIALQNTAEYQKRFAANQDRIKQGLRALTPAEYIGLEDQYQNIMRNYGLPSSYWAKDSMGTQAGLNKFIANDVSAAELEDRISTAVQRVNNADVNVMNALKAWYPDLTKGDVLAYTLDPTNALNDIKRKITSAEIGGAALAQGLGTSLINAEDLARYGITKAQAQQGYAAIGEMLPTATKLGDIYANQGLGPYTQATAEAETFNTAGAAEAARKRKRLAQLEQAQFSGSSGTSGNALSRDRAMTNQMLGTPGAGAF